MGGRYPFFLQIACGAWFEFLEMAGEQAERYAGEAVPEEVLQAFRDEAEPHFEYVLETVDDGERAAIAAAAAGESPEETAEVEELMRRGYLARDEESRIRCFSDEFARFVRRSS